MMWQANKPTGGYHNSLNQDMFMKWLKSRLTPAFQAKHPGKNKFFFSATNRITTVGTKKSACQKDNNKKHNVEFQHNYGTTFNSVPRTGVDHRFKGPTKGSFPQANCKQGGGGGGADEVAAVTRSPFNDKHPQHSCSKGGEKA